MSEKLGAFGSALKKNGLNQDTKLQSALDSAAEERGARGNGPYEILGVWSGKNVTVIVEQNTDHLGEHDPVAIVEGRNGYKSIANPEDVDLIVQLVKDAGKGNG